MAVTTYNAKKVIVLVGMIPMSGFADGSFVTVEREDDAFKKVVGADGHTSRSKSSNKSGSMTITLNQTTDDTSGLGVVPIAVRDASGRTLIASAFGWIKKVPKTEFGKELTNREWQFDLADVSIFTGGNNV
jgi:hypothetical protein